MAWAGNPGGWCSPSACAPDWIPGVGWEPGTGVGSPNVNLTLFDFQGRALPSIGIFRNPAAVCESYNPDNAPCTIGS